MLGHIEENYKKKNLVMWFGVNKNE